MNVTVTSIITIVATVFAGVLLGGGVALYYKQEARATADLAAMAVADGFMDWEVWDACELAARATAHSNATLEYCDIDGPSGRVRVVVSIPTLFGRVMEEAHAGPPTVQ